MKRFRKGFTLIEIALFLAITGMVFVGVTVGTQNSVYQQRYNDSVQSFADFLRNIYAQTLNVQSLGSGNSEQAIYGKLVTFGESYNSAGNYTNEYGIYAYDVVGRADTVYEGTGSTLDLLRGLGMNVVVKNKDNKYEAAGIIEKYETKWQAEIQKTDSSNNYKGTLLVVRHPRSGTVYTYVAKNNDVLEVNKSIKENVGDLSNLLTDFVNKNSGNFIIESVDFCVAASGEGPGNMRRDVRVVANARNASGVEVIGSDNKAGGNNCAQK